MIEPGLYLTPEARIVFDEIARSLVDAGIALESCYGPMLGVLAGDIVEAREYRRTLAAEGYTLTNSQGQRYRHPYVSMLRGVERMIASISDKFGLNPTSRRRILAAQNRDDWAAERRARLRVMPRGGGKHGK